MERHVDNNKNKFSKNIKIYVPQSNKKTVLSCLGGKAILFDAVDFNHL